MDDGTKWNSRTVGNEALEALRRLTLEDLPADRAAWSAWLAANRDLPHGTVFDRWLAKARNSMAAAPIWTMNAWMAKIRWTRDPRVLPLVGDYLRRRDLAASAIGPNSSSGGGGDGPQGEAAPVVTALLLGLAQHGVGDAVNALEGALGAVDPDVRQFGAMALAAYRPRQAVERLAAELAARDAWQRNRVGGLLLMLGDARGIPARIKELELGSGIYSVGVMMSDGQSPSAVASDSSRGIRMFACRDLRVYTQQPLPCDPNATGDALAAQVTAWRAWWNTSRSGFAPRTRQARLDLGVQYQIHPVTIGSNVVR
jgi:hypothetical protein